MDSRLKAAYDFSNYRATLNQELEQHHAEYAETLIVQFGGGFFTVDTGLIAYIDLQIRNNAKNLVLVDNKKTPILIEDLAEFNSLITSTYNSAVNKLFMAYTDVKKKRTVKKLIEE